MTNWRKVERERKKETDGAAATGPDAIPVPPAAAAAAPRVINAGTAAAAPAAAIGAAAGAQTQAVVFSDRAKSSRDAAVSILRREVAQCADNGGQ